MHWRTAVLRQASLFDAFSGAPSWPVSSLPPRLAGATAIHSLLFAVVPDSADATRLHAHARQVEAGLGLAGRALEAARLHVTLHLVGEEGDEPPQAEIDRWCRAAASVRRAPFEVVFDRVSSFGGDGHPLVFTSSDDTALLALHQALGIALADTGEPIRRRRAAPHMTLSYRGKRVSETPIEPVRWRANQLVLVDSHLGDHVHDVRGRWLLQD
jgi:2'-5' RNA ligase